MEENKLLEANFNLMQNVIDKLDEVFKKIENISSNNDTDKKESTESNVNSELLSFSNLTRKSHRMIIESHKKSIENITNIIIKKSNTKPNIITNTKQYVLIGKDSPVKFKTFLFVITVLLMSWWSIKYIPNFILKNEELKESVENYTIYYNYQYLKNLEADNKKSAEKNQNIMTKIKTSNSDFFEEYNNLVNEYNKEK